MSIEFGQTTGGVAPDAVALVTDSTTMIAGVVLIVLLLGLAVFLGAANHSATGSVWDFGRERQIRRRKRRPK